MQVRVSGRHLCTKQVRVRSSGTILQTLTVFSRVSVRHLRTQTVRVRVFLTGETNRVGVRHFLGCALIGRARHFCVSRKLVPNPLAASANATAAVPQPEPHAGTSTVWRFPVTTANRHGLHRGDRNALGDCTRALTLFGVGYVHRVGLLNVFGVRDLNGIADDLVL